MREPVSPRGRSRLSAKLRSLRAENAALRRSESLLRAVVEGIDDPVFAEDSGGRILLINGAGARRLGREAGEVVGRAVTDLFPPEDARRIRESDRRVMAGEQAGTRVEIAETAGGTGTRLITKSAYRDGRGRVIGLVGMERDVSGLARAEAEAIRQAEVLRTIFDHIPVMINFIGRDGRARLVNREWERVLGWSREEAVRRDIAADLYPDPELRREVLDFVLNPRGCWREFRTRTRDGRTLDTTWANVLLSDGTSVGIGLDVTQRKRADREARAVERQFQAVFEGAPDAMVLADDDGRYVNANPAACLLFGLPLGELLGKTLGDFAAPRSIFEAAWAEFRAAGTSRGAFPLARPDGTRREAEFSATADVLPGLHLSVLRDVTERRQSEEALRASERRVVAILESITDGFFALDPGCHFSYVNPQAEALLGRSREELLGRSLWEAFPEALGTSFEREYRRAMAERIPVGFEAYYPPLGRWSNVHAYPSADGLSIYFTDVTQRRQAEEALRQTEARFRLVLENSRDVIYQLNLLTKSYDYISPSVSGALGYTPEALAAGGLPLLRSLIHPEDLPRWEAHVGRLMTCHPREGPEPVLEYRMRVPGKGWRCMSDSVTVIRDEAGAPVAAVGNVRDVSELKRDEKRMREDAARLQDVSRRLTRAEEDERGRIARELHDEIGQALTALKLNLLALIRGAGAPTAARRLEDSVGLVERTIGQVRGLSLDLRPSLLDDLGLVPALRSHVACLARRSGLAATFRAPEGLGRLDPEIETACYRIAQEALTNVARHSDASSVRVELEGPWPELRLLVADDGAGFDATAATALAVGGASLGLLGMRERAARLGGRVEIASGPGRGAEIRATLPLPPPPPPTVPPAGEGGEVRP